MEFAENGHGFANDSSSDSSVVTTPNDDEDLRFEFLPHQHEADFILWTSPRWGDPCMMPPQAQVEDFTVVPQPRGQLATSPDDGAAPAISQHPRHSTQLHSHPSLSLDSLFIGLPNVDKPVLPRVVRPTTPLASEVLRQFPAADLQPPRHVCERIRAAELNRDATDDPFQTHFHQASMTDHSPYGGDNESVPEKSSCCSFHWTFQKMRFSFVSMIGAVVFSLCVAVSIAGDDLASWFLLPVFGEESLPRYKNGFRGEFLRGLPNPPIESLHRLALQSAGKCSVLNRHPEQRGFEPFYLSNFDTSSLYLKIPERSEADLSIIGLLVAALLLLVGILLVSLSLYSLSSEPGNTDLTRISRAYSDKQTMSTEPFQETKHTQEDYFPPQPVYVLSSKHEAIVIGAAMIFSCCYVGCGVLVMYLSAQLSSNGFNIENSTFISLNETHLDNSLILRTNFTKAPLGSMSIEVGGILICFSVCAVTLGIPFFARYFYLRHKQRKVLDMIIAYSIWEHRHVKSLATSKVRQKYAQRLKKYRKDRQNDHFRPLPHPERDASLDAKKSTRGEEIYNSELYPPQQHENAPPRRTSLSISVGPAHNLFGGNSGESDTDELRRNEHAGDTLTPSTKFGTELPLNRNAGITDGAAPNDCANDSSSSIELQSNSGELHGNPPSKPSESEIVEDTNIRRWVLTFLIVLILPATLLGAAGVLSPLGQWSSLENNFHAQTKVCTFLPNTSTFSINSTVGRFIVFNDLLDLEFNPSKCDNTTVNNTLTIGSRHGMLFPLLFNRIDLLVQLSSSQRNVPQLFLAIQPITVACLILVIIGVFVLSPLHIRLRCVGCAVGVPVFFCLLSVLVMSTLEFQKITNSVVLWGPCFGYIITAFSAVIGSVIVLFIAMTCC